MKDSVNILGSEYKIHFVDKFPDYLSDFEESANGLCNFYDRTIFVRKSFEKDTTEIGKENLYKRVLRHEIIHAFIFESGLSSDATYYSCGWAENEEMVDWIAIQSTKIFKVFQYLEII